jgi:hypothetical protein
MNKTSKFHYVYRVTSLIENKHYYGSRSSILHPKEDLGIKYFTSSTDKVFKNKFKQNPKEFKLKIVSIFNSRQDALLFEIKLHNKFEVGKNPSFYNRAKATSTGWSNEGVPNSKEHCLKIGNSQLGFVKSDETKQKISKSKKGVSQGCRTEEHSKNWLLANKGIPKKKVKCPHCDKVGGGGAMSQWHFANCRFLNKTLKETNL